MTARTTEERNGEKHRIKTPARSGLLERATPFPMVRIGRHTPSSNQIDNVKDAARVTTISEPQLRSVEIRRSFQNVVHHFDSDHCEIDIS